MFATATHENMESIRSFHAEDTCVEIPLGARIRGNLQVVVYHVRAIPVAKKAGIVSIHCIRTLCTCTLICMFVCVCVCVCVCLCMSEHACVIASFPGSPK